MVALSLPPSWPQVCQDSEVNVVRDHTLNHHIQSGPWRQGETEGCRGETRGLSREGWRLESKFDTLTRHGVKRYIYIYIYVCVCV